MTDYPLHPPVFGTPVAPPAYLPLEPQDAWTGFAAVREFLEQALGEPVEEPPRAVRYLQSRERISAMLAAQEMACMYGAYLADEQHFLYGSTWDITTGEPSGERPR